jgi:hypothetical protein
VVHDVAAHDHDQGGDEHVVLKAHGQAAALLDAVEEGRDPPGQRFARL